MHIRVTWRHLLARSTASSVAARRSPAWFTKWPSAFNVSTSLVLISPFCATQQARCALVKRDQGEVCGPAKTEMHTVSRQVGPAIMFEHIGFPARRICMHFVTLLLVVPTYMRQVSELFEFLQIRRARLAIQSQGPAVRLPIGCAVPRDEEIMLLLHARHVFIAKRLMAKRLAGFLIHLRVAVSCNPSMLEEAVGEICVLLLPTVVRDHNGDHGQFMQRSAASQCAKREAPGEQMMDLSGDTAGTRVQADQGIKDGVELLVVGLLKVHTVELLPDLLGTNHDGVEAVQGLAPLLLARRWAPIHGEAGATQAAQPWWSVNAASSDVRGCLHPPAAARDQ
jgi:hypothetical protein